MVRELLGNIKGTQLLSSVFISPVPGIDPDETLVLNDEIDIPDSLLKTPHTHIKIVMPCSLSGDLDFDIVLKRGTREYFRLPILIEETGRSQGSFEIDLYSTPNASSRLYYIMFQYPTPTGIKSEYRTDTLNVTELTGLMSLSIERRVGGFTMNVFGTRIYKLG